MKRPSYSQWVQTGLLGIVAGSSIVLPLNLANAQAVEEAQPAEALPLSAAEQSIREIAPKPVPTPSEAVISNSGVTAGEAATVGKALPAEAEQTVQPAIATTQTNPTIEDTPPVPVKSDTSLEVKGSTHAEAVIAEDITESSPPSASPVPDQAPVAEGPVVEPETSSPRQAPDATPVSGISILTPGSGSVIDKPATTVIIEFGAKQKVELRVNGKAVDSAQVGRTETNSATQKIRQTWYGVILDSGVNTITVNEVGQDTPSASIQVEVPGEPDQIKVRTTQSTIPADGRSTAQVLGFLLDANGNQSNWDAIVTLETTAGDFIGTDYKPDIPGFQVEAIDGKFTADLQSSISAGLVRIRATSLDLEGFHQFQFSTPVRPSGLLTGAVDVRIGRRGTNFFDSFRDFLPVDGDNGFEVDARAQAFGITSVGDWLLSGAFNSARSLNEDCNGESALFKASGTECDNNSFSTFGDNSITDVTAPSTDNFFVRLERTSPVPGAGSDYFTWGDFHTEEFARSSQLFTATSRSLHGFKGNFNVGNLQLTALYGNNAEGFQRDIITPDGTSGFYFLSQRLLVPGSEEIYLELEELNRPGLVLERERLERGADYEVDYDRGTLKFQRPVLRTDVDENGFILVRRIVATYRFEGEGGNTDTFGGRAQYTFSRNLDQESWIGATYFREDRGSQDFELFGADALVSFGKDAVLIAEYARSNNSLDFADPVSGDAVRVELDVQPTDKISGRAYFQRADEGFSNNATTSFIPGQTRYGAEILGAVTNNTKLRASFDREENFGVASSPLDLFEELIEPGFAVTPRDPINNSLTTITAGVLQRIGDSEVSVDYVRRDRSDRLTGEDFVTDQIRSTARVPITRQLTLRAINETTFSSEIDPIHPNRTTVGLEYEVYPGISVGLNNSFLTGGQFEDDFITSLDITGQHTFSTDTTLRGQLSALGDLGIAGFFGIDQALTIAPGLRADLSYERVFASAFQQTATSQQIAQPFALGSGASVLGLIPGNSISAGLTYTDNADFQANARIEFSDTPQGSNTLLSANVLGRATRELTVLGSYQQASASNQTLTGLGTTRDLKVGLAYRDPDSDKFNALLRYEYRENPSTIPDTLLFGRGTGSVDHLVAGEVIYAPNWRWELYGRFGWRSSTSFLAKDLIGTSSISLSQLRATYRINNRWDIGGEVRWIRQNSTGFNEVGATAEVGYYLNPNLRLAAGYAFGDVSDRDLGNSRSASGPFFGITLKLDNNLFRDFGFGNEIAPPQQQESAPEAIQVEQAATPASDPEEGQPTPQAERVNSQRDKAVNSATSSRPASPAPPSVEAIR